MLFVCGAQTQEGEAMVSAGAVRASNTPKRLNQTEDTGKHHSALVKILL